MDDGQTLVAEETGDSIVVRKLLSDDDWLELIDLLQEAWSFGGALPRILADLRAARAKSVVVESDYLDRDFSDEFKGFYATLFRRYRRHTRRFHFFDSDVTGIVAGQDAALRAEQLCKAGEERGYLGFLVQRPVRSAAVARAVLDALTSTSDVYANIEVQADYEVHLLGAQLKVSGIPFMQQDARITACAQASIWMAGRHFHTRHRGPWFSSVQVAEAASSPTDDALATSLPAGAGGLSATNMVRALRAMDRKPYMLTATLRSEEVDARDKAATDDEINPKNPEDGSDGQSEDHAGKVVRIVPDWGELNPADIIARYVESGIPVILGLCGFPSTRDGHAVVAIGTTFREKQALTFDSKMPTIAEFIPYFLVHDDQRGMNIKMPVARGEISEENEEVEYTVMGNVNMILVPLPDKVFMDAESAEIKARDMLETAVQKLWPDIRTSFSEELGASVELGDQLALAWGANRAIARTYLVFGWKYKEWIVTNLCPNDIKSKIAAHELPRMLWVTEFSVADDINKKDPGERRILAHCALDSTASEIEWPIVFHMPGLLWLWSQRDPEFYTASEHDLFAIKDDCKYKPRARRLLCR